MLAEKIESVEVNGIQIKNADVLVPALKNMCDTPAHHSHPTNNYRLALKVAKGILQLDLRRDSENPNEYWVFYPRFFSTQNNEIGRVCTSALTDVG